VGVKFNHPIKMHKGPVTTPGLFVWARLSSRVLRSMSAQREMVRC
jgi:hypothetical protein